jgi:hypothetical protein
MVTISPSRSGRVISEPKLPDALAGQRVMPELEAAPGAKVYAMVLSVQIAVKFSSTKLLLKLFETADPPAVLAQPPKSYPVLVNPEDGRVTFDVPTVQLTGAPVRLPEPPFRLYEIE